jgi:PadR family transcriptional regulator PadR
MLQDPESEWYGLQLCRATGIKPGTGYPILHRLLRAGWLSRSEEKIDPQDVGRPPRALYRFTPEGLLIAEEAVDAQLAALALPRRRVGATERAQPA